MPMIGIEPHTSPARVFLSFSPDNIFFCILRRNIHLKAMRSMALRVIIHLCWLHGITMSIDRTRLQIFTYKTV